MSHITMGGADNFWIDLAEKYRRQLERIWDNELSTEHCEEYEELTMEEKLLVDVDMEFLKDETDMRYLSGLSRQTLEKCLSKLRKRDRENGKRNGR